MATLITNLKLREFEERSLSNVEVDSNFLQLNTDIQSINEELEGIRDDTIPDLNQDLIDGLAVKQPLEAKLTSISAVSNVGFLSVINTTTGAVAARSLVAGDGIQIAHEAGVVEGPIIAITDNVLTNTSNHVLSNKSISGNNNIISSISLTSSVVGVLPIANGGTAGHTAAEARNNLGLGSMAVQNSNSVVITGGNINVDTITIGGTVKVANGGTGASTAAAARTNLGLGSMAVQNGNSVNITGGTITLGAVSNATSLRIINSAGQVLRTIYGTSS